MSKKTINTITRWAMVCGLVLVAFLWLIKPVFGIISAVALVLGYNLAITFSPSLQDARRQAKADRKKWLSSVFSRKKTKADTTGPGDFIPTHYLVNPHLNPPVYRLVDKVSFVVGRDAGCDLRITGDNTISGQHCKITYGAHSRQYYVEDLRSAMGTFVGTKRLEANAPEKLSDEAELFISNLQFRFTRIAGAVGGQTPGGTTNIGSQSGILNAGMTEVGQVGLMVTLTISHEGNTRIETIIVGSDYTMGRSSQCSLELRGDKYLSGRHAALSVRDGLVYITDLASSNGTFIEDKRIQANQPVALSSGDMVRIGRHYVQVVY